MEEKIKRFWRDHKEEIKTGAILVITPIAVMGVMATKGLNDITRFLSNATERETDK